MAQAPLSTGDFAVALAVAHDSYRYGDSNPYYHAITAGLDAVKKMRQVKRLPPGAKEMRARIEAAMKLRHERDSKREIREAFVHVYERKREHRVKRMTELKFAQAWAQCSYPWMTKKDAERAYRPFHPTKLPAFYVNNDAKERPTVDWQYGLRIYLSHRWLWDVACQGIAVVEGTLILEARPVRDFRIPKGIDEIWDVWKLSIARVKGDGRKGFVDRDVVFKPSDRRRKLHFAPERGRVFGAIEATAQTSAYRKARKKVNV